MFNWGMFCRTRCMNSDQQVVFRGPSHFMLHCQLHCLAFCVTIIISQLVFWLAVVSSVNSTSLCVPCTQQDFKTVNITVYVKHVSFWWFQIEAASIKSLPTHLTPQEKESLEPSDNRAFVDFVQEGIWPKIRVMCSSHCSPATLNLWDPKAGCLSNISRTVFCLKLHSFNPDCFCKWCTRT